MDIETLEWSDHMLKEFGIDKTNLPLIIKSSSDDFGVLSTVKGLEGVPITG